MKRHLLATAPIVGVLLLIFLAVGQAHVPFLSNPRPWLSAGGPMAGAVSVGLLAADIAIPVPTSVVMVATGALFGVLLGTVLSLLGGLASFVLGFGIGVVGRSPLATPGASAKNPLSMKLRRAIPEGRLQFSAQKRSSRAK